MTRAKKPVNNQHKRGMRIEAPYFSKLLEVVEELVVVVTIVVEGPIEELELVEELVDVVELDVEAEFIEELEDVV